MMVVSVYATCYYQEVAMELVAVGIVLQNQHQWDGTIWVASLAIDNKYGDK